MEADLQIPVGCCVIPAPIANFGGPSFNRRAIRQGGDDLTVVMIAEIGTGLETLDKLATLETLAR